jgi:hypothetical protein
MAIAHALQETHGSVMLFVQNNTCPTCDEV